METGKYLNTIIDSDVLFVVATDEERRLKINGLVISW